MYVGEVAGLDDPAFLKEDERRHAYSYAAQVLPLDTGRIQQFLNLVHYGVEESLGRGILIRWMAYALYDAFLAVQQPIGCLGSPRVYADGIGFHFSLPFFLVYPEISALSRENLPIPTNLLTNVIFAPGRLCAAGKLRIVFLKNSFSVQKRFAFGKNP
jgi:hypothetical protein